MRKHLVIISILLCISFGCKNYSKVEEASIRNPVDSIGFAYNSDQMNAVIDRIMGSQSEYIEQIDNNKELQQIVNPRVVISPHDDYAYVGYLYPKVLEKIKAKTIILFGVAHKARKFSLQDKIVFGSFEMWNAPAGPIKVSSLQKEIISMLPENSFIVHDSMQMLEHSLEALVPFLQYYNQEI